MMKKTIAAAGVAILMAGAQHAAQAASPSYEVDVDYDVSLLGLSIGSMKMSFVLKDGRYEARAFVKPEGLASTFTSNTVNAVANGEGRMGAMAPVYSWIQQINPKRTQTVQISFAGGAPVKVEAQPVYDVEPWTPTREQTKDTFDPVSGVVAMMLLPTAGAGDKACGDTIPIYDGKRRYNFDMWSDGMREVKRGAGGYGGPVLQCVASYRRIAGWNAEHIAKASNTKVNAWFAPIGRGENGGPAFYLPVRLWADAEIGDVVAIPRRVTINGMGWSEFFIRGG